MLDATRAHGMTFLVPANDRTIGGALKIFGQFAPAEIELIAAYMDRSEPGTLVDLGANIGALCLPLARTHPNWRVIAVEAHQGLAQILSANAFSNHLDNVEVMRIAVGAEEGIVSFPEAPLDTAGNLGTLSLQQTTDHPTSRVLMQTIDAIAPADTRFIKIDIEGYEPDALKGGLRTLGEVRPVLLVESNADYETSAREVNRILMDQGYDLFWFFSPFTSADNPPKAGWGQPKRHGDYSVLALPPGIPNLWNLAQLKAFDEARPKALSAFRYLARYGFSAPTAPA